MNALLRLNARLWLALALGLLLTVTVLSLIPRPELQSVVPGSDKLHHLIAYAAVAAPIALARPRRWLWLLAGLAAWSAGIEIVQPYVNRQMSLLDFAANAGGVCLGVVLAAALRRLTPTD